MKVSGNKSQNPCRTPWTFESLKNRMRCSMYIFEAKSPLLLPSQFYQRLGQNSCGVCFSFLHSKDNFSLLAHLSNICHIKLFIYFCSKWWSQSSACVLMSPCIHWSFFEKVILLPFFLTFSYSASLRIPPCVGFIWSMHYLECRNVWEVDLIYSRW